MKCIMSIDDRGEQRKLEMNQARIIVTSCSPVSLFHVIVEYKNEQQEEDREGGYYQTVTLHYDAAKDSATAVCINSPTLNLKPKPTEVQNG